MLPLFFISTTPAGISATPAGTSATPTGIPAPTGTSTGTPAPADPPGGNGEEITLDEDNSRHIIQVLRMQRGERLQLTDGKGRRLTAVIEDDHKKRCRVRIQSIDTLPPRPRKVTLAISLLKNASRFEWFLEKATEIGVHAVVPLVCERTERQHARLDRWRSILVSAMLQSQQSWLPVLQDPTSFEQTVATATQEQRFIAHCLTSPSPTASLTTAYHTDAGDSLLLIGPEGDFSSKEVEAALSKGFVPVTLGETRLRTETAGVVAATLLLNYF